MPFEDCHDITQRPYLLSLPGCGLDLAFCVFTSASGTSVSDTRAPSHLRRVLLLTTRGVHWSKQASAQ
jgi:hypothetical protein